MSAPLQDLVQRLQASGRRLPSAVVGFDGFVDEMITVVGERQNLDAFVPVHGIGDFGALVAKAAGKSSLREIVVNAIHPGGCAVNMGDGLASLGIPVDCFATLGEPIHPAFHEIASKFRSCHSWGKEPGRTLAFEFSDGKLMFSAVTPLADFTPDAMAAKLMDGAYAEACASAKVIALTDWTLYPHMTSVWRFLQKEVYGKLTHRPSFYIDLVDPSTRSTADIRTMLNTLPGFETAGPLTLGLNGNEANILARIFCIRDVGDDMGEVRALAETLQRLLGISEVVIHCTHFAATSSATESAVTNTTYCPNPKKSTGAGDRFNAGFCLGILLGLDACSRITLGCACSGYFVRNARSPSFAELTDFVAQSIKST
jgi:sugar/nucleoside kinase (ribokinase family)